jgi:TonB-linked SusC/RagA family outer membrane protein
MKSRFVWLALAGLASMAGSSLAAQVRVLTGTVTDSATGAPIAGVTVTIPGTRLGAYGRDNGTFLITNVPAGPVSLVVRSIGYKRRTVTVAEDVNAVEIWMVRDFLRLEEIVVTGQGTGVQKLNLPNAVATVGADELLRTPAPTLEAALQGKVPGAYIQANGGAPGGGIQLNLRGISTINAGADPLFVVDGIVISNSSIPNGQNAVTAAAAGGNASNQDNPTNRLADINPSDIERIEILKGGSAAAIYGSKASNGVVIITTKRGQQGRPQFNISQRFGFAEIANTIGQRTFRDSAEAVTVYDPTLVSQFFRSGQTTDYEALLYGRRALASETELSLSGGTEQTRYFISGLVKNEPGIAIRSGYKKQGFRVNLDQTLGRRFSVALSTNVVHSRSARALSNNDNTGTSPGLVLPFTPSFFDPRPDSTGAFPANPFERSNPLQTLSLLTNREDVWRAIGTVTGKVAVVTGERHNLTLTAVGGLDYFDQRNDFLSPPELQYEPLDGQAGTVILGKAANLNTNLSLNAAHEYTPASRRWNATTSLGVQYEYRELNTTSIVGRTLLTGQSSPDQATSRDVAQDIRPVKDLGIYGQEELLLLDRRLLLTVGLRADRSSNNGDPGKYYYYPKAAASYRLIAPVGGVDEVKLRGAYGETGNQPVFGAKFSPDTSGIIDGNFGTQVGQRAGDANIRPERQKELELGFDAQLADGRAQLAVSWYQRRITDLLLDRTLAPSVGQLTRIGNSGGTLRNRGLEIGLQVVPVRSGSLYWVLGASFARNRSQITRLPVPAFATGGFGTSLGEFQIEEGKSATQIIGLVNGVRAPIGDAYPDFQMGFSNDVEWKRFRFAMHWDWKKGGDVVNLTRLLFDAGSNSPDVADGGAARIGEWAAGNTKVYLEDGSYLKMREISVSYDLPSNLVAGMFGGSARSARISLSGRNLIRIADYTGYDPEVSNFGNQAIVRNIDVAPYPPSRSFYLSVDVGF